MKEASVEFPDSVEVGLRKVENGYVVRVSYPKSMVSSPMTDLTEGIFTTISSVEKKKDEGEPIDPTKLMNELFGKFKKPPKPLRKANEEYIFQNMESMLKFVQETFESVDEQRPAE